MMTRILFSFLIFYSIDLFAQTPEFVWGKCGPADEGTSVAVDRMGNIFVTGEFAWDSTRFEHILLYDPLSTYRDMFLVKYDSTGKLLWAKSGNCPKEVYSSRVVTDDEGNAYVGGFFTGGTLRFNDSLEITSSSRDHTGFIVKFDPAGNAVWAERISGGTLYDMTLDAAGGLTFVSTTNDYIIAVGKIHVPGQAVVSGSWGHYYSGNDAKVFGFGICTDNNANVYVAGKFESSELLLDTIRLVSRSPGSGESFIAKFDSAGKIVYAKCLFGNGDNGFHQVTTDANGNTFAIGYYYCDTMTCDDITFIDTSKYDLKYFVAAFDPSGKSMWIRRVNGYSIGSGPGGIIYTTGSVKGIWMTDVKWPRNANDFYLGAYDISGKLLWEKVFIDNNWAVGKGVVTDSRGNIYVTGFYSAGKFEADAVSLSGIPGRKKFMVLKLGAVK